MSCVVAIGSGGAVAAMSRLPAKGYYSTVTAVSCADDEPRKVSR
jgi:hypothetical protein